MAGRRSHKSETCRSVFVGALLASASSLPAYAAATAGNNQDIIITATKRAENLQSVAVSVQALTPKILEQHQVVSLDDYVKLLPSVSFQSFGPGQSQLFFRGISSGGDGLHGGSEPATGVYIDEVPVSTIANGVDLHIYDIARVEALSGPQGTLFGASSLSGTLRIITNQPDTSKFAGGYDLQLNKFGKGDPGGVAEGFVNLPLTDRAAIRLVGFYEHDGGYIDNVLHSRTFQMQEPPAPPPGTLTVNNARFVKNNFNDVETWGGRAALKIDLDQHWTVTPSIIYQHQRANGTFLYDPKIGDLKVADFGPDLNVDSWYQAALTVQGKIGNWDVLYAGGYFGRTVDNQADYSYYSVAYDAVGYTSLATFPDGHGGFLDPDQYFSGRDVYTKETHELRLASPANKRLRAVAGLFYQRQTDEITANYFVPGAAAAFAAGGPIEPVPGAGDDVFYTRISRIDRDWAAFGELAFDILPNLTLTGGLRGFGVDNTLIGFSGLASNALSPSCVPMSGVANLPDPGGVPCGNVPLKAAQEDGETHKINLTWRIDPDRMVYFTYSTGFRPGGVNRRPGVNPYKADTLTNFEVGWKTTWLDGRLRLNGALFLEEWHNVQFALSPPGSNGVTNIYNAGDAESKGFEADAVWRIGDHWTVSGSATYADARLTTDFCHIGPSGNPDCSTGTPVAAKGDQLPVQPPFKAAATVRYDFNIGDFRNFLQGSVEGQNASRSFLEDDVAAAYGSTAPFVTFDFSGGVSRDNWSVEVFIENAFDQRGPLSLNTVCSTTFCGPFARIYPTKPQLFGVKFGQKF